jgi:pimeloyl-ACP methyl ester carboxylesterase
MTTRSARVDLITGVGLNVVEAGPSDAPPVILLHGFPESHRTWRGLVPLLEHRFRLIMPDQRGFGASDQPQDSSDYESTILIDDIFALAEALGLARFALVGHDWGGAIAWGAALRGDPRLERLGIVNAPHPYVFQKSLIEDAGQRAAAQYINALRTPGIEAYIRGRGLDWFFDKTFADHVAPERMPDADERARYLADWARPGALEAMINWYRAGRMVVPPPGVTVPLPDLLLNALPSIKVPSMVVWGMRDPALLPVQLDGLDRLVDHLTIVRLPDAGHFAPWEAPGAVAEALGTFLDDAGAARARA